MEKYIRRHCEDHGIDPDTPAPWSLEDCERNLSLYCLFFHHKYTIGNPTLLPDPFWEIHEFVSNWSFSQADLEQNVPMKQRAFTLKPFAERSVDAEYRRYKQLEVPRQCQKTSTVTKAFVTQESLAQYFLHGNRNFRVVITSATSTLVVKLLRSYRQLWSKNQNIKRLFGTSIELGSGKNKYKTRISMLAPKCGAGLNALAFRWLTEAEDTSGMASFSVMVAGVQTEMVGQRADLYVFDDPASQQNSNSSLKRAKVMDCFAEQVRQLDHNGRMIVCNTRKHLEDFGGAIAKSDGPLRNLFHTLHRKAEWLDADGVEHLYYPVDGEGTEKLSRKKLDELRRSMTAREYSSEYLNEPLDETLALFKREDFQMIDPAKCPIEIRAGLGHDITPEERGELEINRARIVAYNHCDPAGKEDQSLHGDDSAIIGWRVDRWGNLYLTHADAGQWASSRLWDHLYDAFCYNRPQFTDYELPASEMHVRSSYSAWVERKQRDLDNEGKGARADIRPLFESLPKSAKDSRIESMEPWARAKRIFILTSIPEPIRNKFVEQYVNHTVIEHNDLADASARVVRFLRPADFQEQSKVEQPKSDFTQKDGVTGVPFEVLLQMQKPKSDGLLWGQRGMNGNG